MVMVAAAASAATAPAGTETSPPAAALNQAAAAAEVVVEDEVIPSEEEEVPAGGLEEEEGGEGQGQPHAQHQHHGGGVTVGNAPLVAVVIPLIGEEPRAAAIGSPIAASSNLFDTNTTATTLPLPPFSSHSGIVEAAGTASSSSSSEEEGEEDEDAATWAALPPLRPAHPLAASGSASSSLSDADEALLASMRIGERAATPAQMRRGMGLPLTPRGFELDGEDWEDYYYYYGDGLGVGEAYPYPPKGGLSERARRRLPTSVASAAEQGECHICQDNISATCEVTRLPCGRHHYHAGCVDRWLQQSKTCPDCRFEIPESEAGAEAR